MDFDVVNRVISGDFLVAWGCKRTEFQRYPGSSQKINGIGTIDAGLLELQVSLVM